MDVTLKVLEGAKSGAKIAVKKAEFIIGRSQECHLCAGSSAISRRHCAILRDETRVAIKDLGSRNGTLVNGHKIEGEVELTSGDEVVVGPLKFLVTITAGIQNVKKPEVKSVAEAVVRTAETPHSSVADDDISKWLLGPSSALVETQTIRMDDTNALKKLAEAAEEAKAAAERETTAIETHAPEAQMAESPSKKGPGKLPKVPSKPGSKDSREAAAEALRNWSRRR
jgi:pSer/pThr/pTyr-binding forkhead associated (FHA) protein